ncbi:MAG: methylcobalamin:coenzyme methyltransferase [Acidobacteria bacterium]|jgi:uroporphyrinogen decarboxylase|nr:methylcobalamin:coenzyme methyltransferase [Acidobacteriota bacterium]
MTSRERVLAVFAGKIPDRVPVWLGASPEWKELAKTRAGLKSDEDLAVFVGDDFRRVHATYAGPPDWSPDRAFLHPGATSRTPFGVERTGYGYGQPISHPLAQARTVADIEAYPWPDPAWMDVSRVRAEALAWGGRYAVLGGDWSPFFHDAIDLLGMENLMVMLAEDPSVVDVLLGHIVDYYHRSSLRIFEAAAGAIDIFFIGNDFGTQNGPVVGERTFRRFFLPHLARLARLGHDFGLKVMLHCCGGFFPLIPAMIDAGIEALQSLQPDSRGMAPAGLKAAFGGRIVFEGCIDTHHWLIDGTPELVREKTRETLAIMMPDGGYIASPSHDYLLPETKVENVFALYETVREFGKY